MQKEIFTTHRSCKKGSGSKARSSIDRILLPDKSLLKLEHEMLVTFAPSCLPSLALAAYAFHGSNFTSCLYLILAVCNLPEPSCLEVASISLLFFLALTPAELFQGSIFPYDRFFSSQGSTCMGHNQACAPLDVPQRCSLSVRFR